MATKKKKAPVRKKPVRKAARKPTAPLPMPVAPAPAPAPSQRNGRLLALMIGVLLLAVLWRSQRHAEQPDAAMAPAPEGRSIATEKPAAPKPSPRPTVRRETAGEAGEPSLEFDRSSGKGLTVRCWRPANGQARLDVFGPRNQKVRSLASEAGAAGWQSLEWDGKDETGKSVPAGLYYIRPSAQDLQQVRDVWVKG